MPILSLSRWFSFYQSSSLQFAIVAEPLNSMLKIIQSVAEQLTPNSFPAAQRWAHSSQLSSVTQSQHTFPPTPCRLRVVYGISRNLIADERNFTLREREMLAIVHAVKKWKHDLLVSEIKHFTDNVALKFWSTVQNLSPRQVRWQAYVSMFDIDISHITGVTNTAADALSSHECRIADLVARNFCERMTSLIAEFIQTCPPCPRIKPDSCGKQGLLQHTPLHTRKRQSIATDYVLGLPETWLKIVSYNSIVTIFGRATTMVHFFPPQKTCSAVGTAELLL